MKLCFYMHLTTKRWEQITIPQQKLSRIWQYQNDGILRRLCTSQKCASSAILFAAISNPNYSIPCRRETTNIGKGRFCCLFWYAACWSDKDWFIPLRSRNIKMGKQKILLPENRSNLYSARFDRSIQITSIITKLQFCSTMVRFHFYTVKRSGVIRSLEMDAHLCADHNWWEFFLQRLHTEKQREILEKKVMPFHATLWATHPSRRNVNLDTEFVRIKVKQCRPDKWLRRHGRHEPIFTFSMRETKVPACD